MRNRWWIVLMFLVCWPALALAHPGHGQTEPTTVTHYVAEPVHALPIVLGIAALVIVVAAVILARWRARRC